MFLKANLGLEIVNCKESRSLPLGVCGLVRVRYETQLRRWNDDAEALAHVLRS